MDEQSKKEKDEMIARANLAVDKAAGEFVTGLKGRIDDLEGAIHKNNKEDVLSIAYNLECEAAIFGWPRVTRICKWLRKIFSGDYDKKPEAEDVLKALNTLKLMVPDHAHFNEKRDIELFKDLCPMLKIFVHDI